MNVKGLAAIVTGAGSGLGAVTAEALSAAGAKVALLDINEDGLKSVAASTGGLAITCDVSSAEAAEAAVAQAREANGPCRVLVNCAGIAPGKRIVGRDGPMPLADFEKVIRVNLIGSFNMLRLAAADMLAAEALGDGERGVIVSTSSIAATEGQMGQAAYAASKAGITGMMLPAAREFAKKGVRVLTVAPGLIGTPLLLNMPQEVQDNLAGQVPFPHRFGKPEEYAGLVMHLVENVMLNAGSFRIDGGMRMQ